MKLLHALLPLASFALGHDHQTPLSSPSNPLTLDAIPLLGFGTWNLKENCTAAVSWAIQAGYRHIDCAAAYGNEDLVGLGIQDGLRKTGLSRSDLWITSKLWNDHHEPDRVEKGIDETLRKLGVEYLDLYHMHWPVGSDEGVNRVDYLETWEAMVGLAKKGKARHLGVCNFDYKQLKKLVKHSGYAPAVHQMELHPYLSQPHFVAYHRHHGIHVTAYSPLAGTNPTYKPGQPPSLLKNDVINDIADKRHCTPAQVALMWGMARGTSVIPKSSHHDRIVENLHALECVLEKDDLEAIDKLDKYHWRFNNPAKSWRVPLYEGLEDGKGKHKKRS